ncbi:MAG: hypothetical protein O3B01_24250 [Planctomycetota bacterium]|nr:hypothetical protein [Planctomycetota bacterium]
MGPVTWEFVDLLACVALSAIWNPHQDLLCIRMLGRFASQSARAGCSVWWAHCHGLASYMPSLIAGQHLDRRRVPLRCRIVQKGQSEVANFRRDLWTL